MERDHDIHADAIRQLAGALDTIATSHSRRPGAVLFRQGQPGNGVLVVRHGKVRLSSHDGDTRLPYRTVGPGYVLGLPALFSGQPYSLTAEVLEECDFGFVNRERALQLVRERLALCFEAVDLLAHEVGELREWQAMHMQAASSSRATCGSWGIICASGARTSTPSTTTGTPCSRSSLLA